MANLPDNDRRDPVDHIASSLDFSHDFEVREDLLDELMQGLRYSPVDSSNPLPGFVPQSDDFQARVIESDDKTIRMLAAAGSGKTQTLLNRVLRLVQNGTRADRILLLTFDNAASNSLKASLQKQLSSLSTTLNGLRIQTLNAFGKSLLRQHAPHEDKDVIKRRRAIGLTKEIRQTLENKSPQHQALLPTNLAHSFYLELFSLLKNEPLDPRTRDAQKLADFLIRTKDKHGLFRNCTGEPAIRKVIQAVEWLFKEYELKLQKDGVIDFDDQKLRAYTMLSDSPDLRTWVQQGFEEIIVDEFQDINRLDFVLIKSLAERCRLVITGDDDQAIYGFRGCTPDFIIDLERHLERQVTSHELRFNYRNPPNLLRHANTLIAHNPHRVPKNPIAKKTGVAEIKIVAGVSAGLEAKFILSFIEKVKGTNSKLGYKDFGILYRTNAQSLIFQVEFVLNDVPYYVREQDNILENEVLQRLLGFLRLKIRLADGLPPTSKDAVLSIESYFRFIDPNARNQLMALFGSSRSFHTTLASQDFLRILPKAANSRLIPAVMEALEASSLNATLEVLAKRFKGLRGIVGSLEDAIEERVPLGEIFELAANFRGDSREFVETMELAIRRARELGAGKAKDSGVALLTYFRAKGLQWHTVILPTCNEGLIPHGKSPIEEERRLFYVAMTRAESNLLISYVKKSCNNKVARSRFITEAGLE